jgi:hypothetical protein
MAMIAALALWAARPASEPALRAAAPGERSAREETAAAGPLLFTESFDDDKLLDRGWYDGDRFLIAHQGPFAGRGCLEYGWKRGATNPHTSSGLRRLFEPTESVYLRFRLRLSTGWQWSGRAYHPHLLHFLTTENGPYHGPAASRLTLYVEPQEGRLRLAAQDIQNKDAPRGLTQGPLRGGYNGRFYDSEEVLFNDDRWHTVEALFVLNGLKRDQTLANGVVQGWFDGRLVIDRSDVVFRSSDFPNMRFNQLLLTPYFGPGLLPRQQTLWIDDLSVGTRPPEPGDVSDEAPAR